MGGGNGRGFVRAWAAGISREGARLHNVGSQSSSSYFELQGAFIHSFIHRFVLFIARSA